MNLKQLRPDQQQKTNTRLSYRQRTEDFVSWVNRLGIERTWLGRVAHKLDSQFHLRHFLFLFLFCLGLSFFISWDFDISYSGYKEGDLATSDIKSPLSFEVLDLEQTEQKRSQAEANLPLVYDFDVGLYDAQIQRIKSALKQARQGLILLQEEFEIALGGARVSTESFQWLKTHKFKLAIESLLIHGLEKWNTQKIVDDSSPFKQKGREHIIINVLEQSGKGERFLIDTASVLDVSEVRKRMTNQLTSGPFTNPKDIVEISDLLRSFIVPNLTLNKMESEARRQKIREEIPPVVIQIKKGQVIVREGTAIQKIQVVILDELRKLKTIRHQDFISLVTGLFFVILLYSYKRYLERFTSKVQLSVKDVYAMGTILIVIIFMAKFVLFVANTALVEKFTRVPLSFYTYLVPVSAGAMMVGLLIPFGEVVWLFSVFASVVTGLLLDKNFGFMIVTFTSSIVAARGVYGCKKREDLYIAGLKTGLINALLIFCVTLMNRPNPELLKLELLWNTPAGFLSGILSSFVAMTLIPLWESFFVYTTDVKLLELSNLNHPLLRDLIVKAPGTYHHSLVVGSMCEAAAEDIGANPLLAKVCAYYHDIGKTNYPQYFIENQRAGENRHDKINPGMSKTVLVAHVKDGVEMGLKYKLGKPIIDVIEQHHGTTLISFFYHRAKQREEPEMYEVTEEEYRYPGPKPQFREAALCMLADSIEAAARTLDEPTPSRLQNIVRNIVQKKFLDGQLDECNLTLKDLSLIEAAFSRILLGIYHQRVDYPTKLL